MSTNAASVPAPYALATGANAVGRLDVLHSIYSPVGRRVLAEAGLAPGMRVADFGCGSGTMTRLIASVIGPHGEVTGVDLHRAQLEQARELSARDGLTNTRFIEADACHTGLPSNSLDLVYCRFLLLHLPDPAACLREMWRVLKLDGILVVEDGDLASATSVPPTALDAFAELFGRFGPLRGLDYSLSNRLARLVSDAGFSELGLTVHQPADRAGASGLLLKWSVEEAGPAFVAAGVITREELDHRVAEMHAAWRDPSVLAVAPRMSLVWGRKRVAGLKDVGGRGITRSLR